MPTPNQTPPVDLPAVHDKVRRSSRAACIHRATDPETPIWVEHPLLPGQRLNVQPLFALIHSRYHLNHAAPLSPAILVADMVASIWMLTAYAGDGMATQDLSEAIARLTEYAQAFTAMMDARPHEAG